MNADLELLGLPALGWLRSATWSKPALVLISIWSTSGVAMIIFLAGLKEIPASLMEAAIIDGANPWQRFFYVTLPLLTPTLFFNLIISVITSFQVFALAFVAISAGRTSNTAGPLDSLLMYMIHLYRNAFRYFNMGYASAMALVMFLVLIVITLALIRSSSYWVYYEGGAQR
jgi:multiple sugar transport system permease protein